MEWEKRGLYLMDEGRGSICLAGAEERSGNIEIIDIELYQQLAGLWGIMYGHILVLIVNVCVKGWTIKM